MLFVLTAGISQLSIGAEMQSQSIWALIRDMRALPVDEKSIEDFFGGIIDSRTDNGYWKFYEGKGRTLGDGVTISKFGVTKKNDGAADPLIYMFITGHCVRLGEVREAYPGLVTHRAATIHAPVANYLYADEHGKLTFSFLEHGEDRSDCLANIGYSPKTVN